MEPQYKTGRSWWPGLKILDRYIIRKFLGTYIFAIAMIIIVVVIFDYVEKIDGFTQTHAPFKSIILDYYLNFVPFFINQFSALFTFIACIFFTSKLAYQTEIIAMLSGGMSFRRLMWPYFISATIIAIVSLGLSLWVIPISQRTCVAFEQQYIPRRQRYQYDRHIYRQIEPGTFAYIRGFSKSASQASFVALEKYEGNFMRSTLEASEVKFDEETKRWTAQRYITRHFDDDGHETFKQHRNLDTLLDDRLMQADPAAFARFKALHKGMLEGWTKLHNSLLSKNVSNALSSREREFARLAAFGFSNFEIAAQLSVSVDTVKKSIFRIMNKTGVDKRDQLGAFV